MSSSSSSQHSYSQSVSSQSSQAEYTTTSASSTMCSTTCDISPEMLVDQLKTMRWQEFSAYRTFDYLKLQANVSSRDIQNPTSVPLICPQWREVICEWAFKLADHFDSSREPVGVAVHFVDRYLATLVKSGTYQGSALSKREFKLLFLTCLNIALKMERPSVVIDLDTLLRLSHDIFTRDQIIAMEKHVLKKLEWRMNPPTSFAFLAACHEQLFHHILVAATQSQTMDAVGSSLLDYYSDAILENARFLIELSVLDYYFVGHRASHIAIAALLNALEDIYSKCNYVCPPTMGSPHAVVLGWVDHTEVPSILCCKVRLRALYSNHEDDDEEEEEEEIDPAEPSSEQQQEEEEFDEEVEFYEEEWFGEDISDDDAEALQQSQQQTSITHVVSPVQVSYHHPDAASSPLK